MNRDRSRRDVLRTGVLVGGVSIAGCANLVQGGAEQETERDSDGDGVPNEDDYAPRDASVQEASDVQEVDGSTETETTVTDTPTATPNDVFGNILIDSFDGDLRPDADEWQGWNGDTDGLDPDGVFFAGPVQKVISVDGTREQGVPRAIYLRWEPTLYPEATTRNKYTLSFSEASRLGRVEFRQDGTLWAMADRHVRTDARWTTGEYLVAVTNIDYEQGTWDLVVRRDGDVVTEQRELGLQSWGSDLTAISIGVENENQSYRGRVHLSSLSVDVPGRE